MSVSSVVLVMMGAHYIYSVRRSSVFTSNSQGRTSMAPGVYSTAYKDPRPLRDKVFQSNCMRNVNEYLISVRYPLPLTAKTLTSPTAKEFQSIFKFLVNDLVDPGAAWGKKFEDDTLSILKDLKYPGMDSVSKTALTAPGAPQSWPNMLAMLNWLVDLCKASLSCLTFYFGLPALRHWTTGMIPRSFLTLS